MKKLLVISMITLMSLFVITGCTSSNSNEPAAEVEKTENTDSKKEEVIAEEIAQDVKVEEAKAEAPVQEAATEEKPAKPASKPRAKKKKEE